MAYIKFGDCYTIRKTAKLKQSLNILVTWYIHVIVYSIANILNIKKYFISGVYSLLNIQNTT